MKEPNSLNSTRRRFIKVSALGAATLPVGELLIPRVALAQDAGNEAMQYFGEAASQELAPMDTGDIAAYLSDIVVSDDAEKPITAGLFRLEKGEPLTYTYTYDEVKIIIGGSYEIEDGTGQKVTAVVGDVFYFPKGSTITFSTPDFGLGFFCGQRGEGEA